VGSHLIILIVLREDLLIAERVSRFGRIVELLVKAEMAGVVN
jgi:hypothetical protein